MPLESTLVVAVVKAMTSWFSSIMEAVFPKGDDEETDPIFSGSHGSSPRSSHRSSKRSSPRRVQPPTTASPSFMINNDEIRQEKEKEQEKEQEVEDVVADRGESDETSDKEENGDGTIGYKKSSILKKDGKRGPKKKVGFSADSKPGDDEEDVYAIYSGGSHTGYRKRGRMRAAAESPSSAPENGFCCCFYV